MDILDLIWSIQDKYNFDMDDNDTYDEVYDKMSDVIDIYEEAVEELLQDGIIKED